MEHVVANPVGGALGQLISPLSGTTKQSVRMDDNFKRRILTSIFRSLFLVSFPPLLLHLFFS